MIYQVTKIGAAVDQIDWAIKLFLDHRAYVPSITLAGAAEEIIGETLSSEAAFHQLVEKISHEFDIPERNVGREYLNKIRNWLKHWGRMEDAEIIDIDLEAEAIQYIVRAIANLYSHDRTATSETPRFLEWLSKNSVFNDEEMQKIFSDFKLAGLLPPTK